MDMVRAVSVVASHYLAAARLLGRRPDHLVGVVAGELLHVDCLLLLLMMLLRPLRGRTVWTATAVALVALLRVAAAVAAPLLLPVVLGRGDGGGGRGGHGRGGRGRQGRRRRRHRGRIWQGEGFLTLVLLLLLLLDGGGAGGDRPGHGARLLEIG